MSRKKESQPIQIIGTQRSGSNLFRLMLNQLDNVIAPHPPHILQRFFPVMNHYLKSDNEINFQKLVDDVCRMVELNPVQLVKNTLDRIKVLENCSDRTLISLFHSIYDYFAKEEDAKYWVCKSMANMNFVDELETSDRKHYYIHLFRDGRDVACSFKKAIVGEKHIYHLAKKWKHDQERCLQLAKKVDDFRYICIKYEQLIQNSSAEIKKVCKFLNITFKEAFMNYHESEASKSTAKSGKMWANVGKPLMKNNFNKYRKQLSKEEIIIFEHIAGDMLVKLGYSLEYPEESKAYFISKEMLLQFNLENEALKKTASQNLDPEGQKLRKEQQSLIRKISSHESFTSNSSKTFPI
jgi:hypothetical protein